MQITVELPDDLAAQLFPAGQGPSRAALENIAVEAFRAINMIPGDRFVAFQAFRG
jgi:hypothetical protein